MRQVSNPKEFRSKLREKLFDIVPKERYCINIEKGIYNYSINKSTELNIVKKWNNVYFTQIYLDHFRSVYINLKNNNNLVDKIMSKKLKAHEIALMTHQEIMPERWQILLNAKKLRDDNRYAPQLDANTDNFTCRKCKSNKCSYYQLQTRSADEPMTTFVTCVDCGNRWKC